MWRLRLPRRYTLCLQGLCLPVILLILWQYASGLSASHQYAFVPLQKLYHTAVMLMGNGELWFNGWGSLKRAFIGLVIGTSLGLSLGVLLAYSKLLDAVISPLFNSIRQVPLLGLTPLIALWFGNGEQAKLCIIALASLFPLTINTYLGLKTFDAQYHDLARIYGLSFSSTLRRIHLPQALPHILTGLNLAVPFTWMTTIASELLFNAGAGMGNLMMKAEMNAEMHILLLCAISITLCGMIMSLAIRLVSKRLLAWRN